jgi:type IV secretion system protein VirB6
MGEALVQAINNQGGFLGPTFNVVAESLKYCIVMILMAILCFQAPSLASALAGGAAVQQGVQMIQNAMMVSGLRSRSITRGAAASGSQGGVVRAGTGVPYALGQIAGTARTAAYRLAAMRGRV